MVSAEAPKKRHHPDGHLSSSLSKRLFTLCQASSVCSDHATVTCSDAFVKLSSREDTRMSDVESNLCSSSYHAAQLSSTVPEVTIIGFCANGAPTESTKSFHEAGRCKGSWLTNLDPAKCIRSDAEVDTIELKQNLGHAADCSLCCDFAANGESVSSNIKYRWNRNWEHWKRQSRPEGHRLRDGSSRQTKTCDIPWIARYSKLGTWSWLADKTGTTCGEPNEDPFVDKLDSGSLILGILTEFQSTGLSDVIRRNISTFLDQTKRGMATSNGPYKKDLEIRSGDDVIRGEVLEGLEGLTETLGVGQKCNTGADIDAIFSPVTTVIPETIDAGTDSSYILSSSFLAGANDAGLGRRAFTIDHDFEDYFSELLLM